MIRYFFQLRFFLIFVSLSGVLWLLLWTWMKASKEQHHRWLTGGRLLLIAGCASLALTIGLAIVIQVFD